MSTLRCAGSRCAELKASLVLVSTSARCFRTPSDWAAVVMSKWRDPQVNPTCIKLASSWREAERANEAATETARSKPSGEYERLRVSRTICRSTSSSFSYSLTTKSSRLALTFQLMRRGSSPVEYSRIDLNSELVGWWRIARRMKSTRSPLLVTG